MKLLADPAECKPAHLRSPAYDQTLWQIFLNSSPFSVISNVIGAPSQALQMILEMQTKSDQPKSAVKTIAKRVFFNSSSF